MATATITFSQLNPATKKIHTGVCAVGSAFSLGTITTICPSTILYMVQIPNNTTLLNYWLRIQTGGASQTFQMGTSNSPSGVMSVTTLSSTYSLSTQAVTAPGTGVNNQGFLVAPSGTQGSVAGPSDLMPVRISLSDDVQPQSIWLRGNVSAGCSASAFFTLMLMYTCDGLQGHTTLVK